MTTITKLIAAVITILLVSIVTMNIAIPVATLITYLGYAYLTERVISHIKDKKMPSVLQWIGYALIFVANALVIVGLNYHSVICLIIALISYISSLVCGYFDRKNSVKSE